METARTSPPDEGHTSQFQFGPYVPIIRTNDEIIIDHEGAVDYYYNSKVSAISKRLLGEIFPDDTIVDAPSLVTPLLLKKKTIWPPRVVSPSPSSPSPSSPAPESQSNGTDQNQDSNEQDSTNDVQVLKVISRPSDKPNVIIGNKDRYRKDEDYIKASVIANLTNNTRPTNHNPTLAIQDYQKSSAAQFLCSIGLSRVNEFILEEKNRVISRKIRKGLPDMIPDLEAARTRLIETKRNNSPYTLNQTLCCHQCAFKTDSQLVLDAHLESPHRNAAKFYSCNWCNFKTKDSSQIIFHNHVIHKKFRSRIDKPLSIHCCRYCPFESNSKRKFTSHIVRCEQTFQEDLVQVPDGPLDYPALTSKLITQQDIRIYESTLKSLRLAAYNPHQVKVKSSAHGFANQPILLLPQHAFPTGQSRTRVEQLSLAQAVAPYADLTAYIGRGSAGADKSGPSQQESSHLVRLLSNQACTNNLPYNRTSLIQYPRPQSIFNNGVSVVKNLQNIVMAPASTAEAILAPIEIDLTEDDEQANTNTNSTFLICEICDSYIGDLIMFKSHMQMVHKVKIHHKLNQSTRPPLNCQKCDWRFFTDQGLERHLLGSHGLVTSNMQELADNEKDSGRCSVCGMRCARRLVTHMKDIHKMILKPAQLSYKCTVCSATFSLYRYFENHVYRVHADSIRSKN